jgi:4-alpha-glucanotransferase
VNFPRTAGVLLHPTSLPGPNGIGELGTEALRFLDTLADAGVQIWQMLPLGPTGYGDSPYQVFSAFAGNPLLIEVANATPEHAPDAKGPDGSAAPVDFERVIAHKRPLLDRAVADTPRDAAYASFVRAEASWLPDFALFMALKEQHGGTPWHEWPAPLARREADALAAARLELAPEIEARQVEQFLFFSQFHQLRRAAAERGIRLMGDLPIYAAHDSADVWSNPSEFLLDRDGRPTVQAGVPPDYFSATGQLWGNPLYDWEAMRANGFAWWIRRVRAAFACFDLVRIDHFRGFEAYWEVPGDHTTAADGVWKQGPGDALFRAIHDALGPLPIIAENLGFITPEVEALRERWGYPGMCILQFAFGTDQQAEHSRPHNFPRHAVVYTGTHDNDTVMGWWRSTGDGDSTRSAADVAEEKAFAARYLDAEGLEMHWAMMRAAMASVCDTAIVPMQDLLGQGSEARMNLPGRVSGNWGYRFAWEQVTSDVIDRLRSLIVTYGRQNAARAR